MDEIQNKGQTYADLYEIEKQKFVELFKEMLEFVNVTCESKDFDKLKSCVMEYYPYYLDICIQLSALMWHPDTTYRELVESMEIIYHYLTKNYKNREKDLKEYEERKKEEGDMGFMDEFVDE